MKTSTLIIAAFLALVALHLSSLPQTFWEYDEQYFALGVENYQPLLHHPPPPGAPVYIGAAKIANYFLHDTFRAMLAVSIVFLIVGVLAWMAAFREMTGNVTAAVTGTVLLYASPALLVSGPLPQSDTGAIALLGLAARSSATRSIGWTAIWCAAAIGWRPQLAVAPLVLFLVTFVMARTWRARLGGLALFTIACLAWFVPLVLESGGPISFWHWISGQAAYYAKHDSDLSRSGYSISHLALRFIAHPWGPKWLSVPLLIAAVAGAPLMRRSPLDRAARREIGTFIPLAIGCLVYLVFAIATMDPGDAVRYAIPWLPLAALLAGRALTRVRLLGFLAIAYAAGATWYAWPILRARTTSPSPPVAAVHWIEKNVPRHAVILTDLPLRPHAENLLRGWTTMRIDAGLTKYAFDTSTPMVILADGERGAARGVTFRWPDTDAYRKLTRQHYGAVSVIPLPPAERFRAVQGVHPPERTRDGAAWRWLAGRAVIDLPPMATPNVRITFRTPPEYPLATNRLVVSNGIQSSTLAISRNAASELVLPAGTRRITITADRAFVPAQIPGANNRDRRTLSVMLVRVEQIR